MWMHVDSETYTYSQAGVAVSDYPTGPFRYLGSVKPNGNTARDLTLFKDDDEKAYLVFASELNETMHLNLLADDYLAPTRQEKRILVNKEREAPAIFKHQDKYYLITSACTGWSPNPATYAVTDHPFGNWQQAGNPCVGPGRIVPSSPKVHLCCRCPATRIYLYLWPTAGIKLIWRIRGMYGCRCTW
jgi:hypothetical protein